MNESLKKDALAQIGSIHRLNAPGAIGYLFTENRDGNQVAQGMYCNRVDEIDPARWDYFSWFGWKDGDCQPQFYNLNSKNHYSMLMNLHQRVGLGHFLIHDSGRG